MLKRQRSCLIMNVHHIMIKIQLFLASIFIRLTIKKKRKGNLQMSYPPPPPPSFSSPYRSMVVIQNWKETREKRYVLRESPVPARGQWAGQLEVHVAVGARDGGVVHGLGLRGVVARHLSINAQSDSWKLIANSDKAMASNLLAKEFKFYVR